MRLWMTAVLGLLVGCGDDPRTLTRDDVSGIPPGDAVGAQFSGEYLVANNRIEDCNCRAGGCGTLTGLTGIALLVMQTDGLLQMTSSTSAQVAQGGVNADGRYTLGWAQEDPGNVQYALVHGQFTPATGTPSTMSGVEEVTVHSTVYDCDVRTSFTATYVGPLAAAVGDTAARAARGAPTRLGAVGVYLSGFGRKR